ncbi:MAG: hypothetical protein CVV22_12440 [Ignavibacteriae bacterium HGW-Ignavibacteriae-1]|jgi:radical SAM superfamily enzyme YgiQ (UPF0313 family)|nr:MAG: hypothetical protein CVV22_12440 [Ignavibacteriae bacterium HGW-Ignavibacteriae-1]
MISLFDRNAYGQRLMSANLKKHGHHCSIIFLKRYSNESSYNLECEEGEFPWMGINMQGKIFKYASNSVISNIELSLLQNLLSRLKPDIIGLTVNTPLRNQNIKVTEFIKTHFSAPVIWGGFDPTVNPEKCLEYADFVCLGEGDRTILDIAANIDRKSEINDVCNLAYFKNNEIVFNPKSPLEKVIDNYPWRDNSPDDKYFIEDDKLIENYPEINDSEPGIYQTMSARGCPFKCSYCCEASFKRLYSGEKFLRRRSPGDLISELTEAKKQFNLREIRFEDEIFGMDLKWLKEFEPLYTQHINLPFDAYIYPSPDIEEILTVLKKAGLKLCCLALESGSERINKSVFGRNYNRELFLKAARFCKKLDIKYYTDVITYNPYEQEEDLKQTLEVLLDMQGNFTICVNKLFVLPGTKLAEQMQIDGMDLSDTSRDTLFNYYCRLYWITSSSYFSRPVIRTLEKIPILKKHPELINPLLIKVILSPDKVLGKLKRLVLRK